MAKVRVMFVGHGPSNLPQDRVINVFHFVGTGDYASTRDLAVANVADFYNGTTGQTNSLAYWISAWVSRTAELRAYDLEQPKPRIPTVVPLTLVAGPTDGLPEEVCVCLSFTGAPPISARRRGRIYLGPLRGAAMDSASASAPARPTSVFVQDLASAATRLAQYGPLAQWSIRSTLPVENFVTITHGYVDNAFDTQRRRGPDPTTRTLWTTTGL